jgi:hypothetical protein
MRLTSRLGSRKPRRPTTRLRLERLEDRAVPAFAVGSAFAIGGTGSQFGLDLVTDSAGNVYVTGIFGRYATPAGDGSPVQLDFDPADVNHTNLAAILTAANVYDAFVAKYDATGAWQWVTDLGACPNSNSLSRIALSNDSSAVHVTWAGAGWNGTTLVSSGDLHVARLDAASGATAWRTQLTGPGAPATYNFTGLAVGPTSGRVYAAGVDFGAGAAQAVVAALDPTTGAAVWRAAAAPGGNGYAYGLGLAVDGPENVYVTGPFSGTVDFDPDPGQAANLTSASSGNGANKTYSRDAFVWKLTPGGAHAWAGRMGGTGEDGGAGIAVDGAGRVNVTGWSNPGSNADFDPGPGIAGLTGLGGRDIVAVHLVSTDGGTSYTAQAGAGGWVKAVGGPYNDFATGVAVDSSGNVYVNGLAGEAAPGSKGGTNAVIYKFNGASGAVAAAATISSGMTDQGIAELTTQGGGIRIDASGAVYATGGFWGTANFNPDANGQAYNLTSAGRADAYVLRLTQFTPPPPQITISDVTAVEGRSGTKLFVFTVSLSWLSDQPVTVNFATANGTATAGSDYQAQTGALTIAPGETTKTITIVVNGDKTRESDESFVVNLSGAFGGTILDGQGLGTILNDD